ncbi:MAG: PASTA domain-containing protein [Clostridia bacterium]|nr:PASTA domain-containing protein [Clostridia bacterium]
MSDVQNNPLVDTTVVICDQCGCEVKNDSKFCSSCGKPIIATPSKCFCSVCGEELEANENFCHKCGSASTQVKNNIAMENINAYNSQLAGGPAQPIYTPPQPVSPQYNAYQPYNPPMQNYPVPAKPPKVKKIARIKDFSIVAIISWLLIAFAGVMFTDYAMSNFAAPEHIYGSRFSFAAITNTFSAVSLFLAAVLGTLFWKDGKKLRVLPIISLTLGILSCAATSFLFYGFISFTELLLLGIICVVLLITLLYSTKVIKSKALALSLTIPFAAIGILGYFLTIIGTLSYGFDIDRLVRAFFSISYSVQFPFLYFVLFALLLLPFSLTTKKKEDEQQPDSTTDSDSQSDLESELESAPVTTNDKKAILPIIKKHIAIALIAIIAIFGIIWAYNQTWTTIDNVVGQKYEDVLDEYSGFVDVQGYAYSDTIEEGCVISQTVEAGTKISIHEGFLVVISKGAGVKIPELTNMPVSTAKQTIENLGLTVSLDYAYSDTVAKDNIINASSYHVDEGATVTLIVSMGPDLRVEVPSVVNLTESEATSALKKVGFKVTVVRSYENCNAYYSDSKVISQSHTGKQDPGSTIVITITQPSIQITKVTFDQNYVGGVDVGISFKNLAGKQIKYVAFTARYKNAVGDNVYCTIWNQCTKILNYTGPLNSGRSDTAYWDATIYNWTCSQIHFDKIEVTFMDGTTHEMYYSGYWYK